MLLLTYGDYNPRKHRWADHFELDSIIIKPRTPVGETTAGILGFNEPERILERGTIQNIGRYPPKEAMEHLSKNTA